MGREQRELKNWLISPVVQLRIVSHIILVMVFFTLASLVFSYIAWNQVLALVIEMTDIPSQVRIYLEKHFFTFYLGLVGLLVLQFSIVALLLIVHTHRFVGASFAIRRFIREKLKLGDLSGKVSLRKNDYLSEIAQELNELTEVLSSENKAKDQKS